MPVLDQAYKVVLTSGTLEPSNEFGLLEAYMASYRGNYANYQELATEPNL